MKLSEVLNKIGFKRFVNLFAHMYSPETGEPVKFTAWPKQEEFCDFLESDLEVLTLLKSRQAGGSTITALFAVYECYRRPNTTVLVISKDELASGYYLEKRVWDAIRTMPKIDEITWPSMIKKTASEIKFANGSSIKSLPSSGIASAGITAQVVIIDEVALIDSNASARGGAREIFATVRPVVQKAKGKIIMLSTARAGSWFNEVCMSLLKDIKPGMGLFFFPADADPTLTPQVLSDLSEQYPGEVEFKREYPLTPEDAFLTNQGLVFKTFGKGNLKEFDVDPNWDIYIGMDWGFRHPTVVIFGAYDWTNDTIYIYDEMYFKEKPAEIVSKELRPILANMPKKPRSMVADTMIFNQTGHRQSIADVFRQCGIYWQKSSKHRGLIAADGSLSMMSMRFTVNKLIVHPRCVGLINELRTWCWKDKGRDEPVDINDDAVDACFEENTLIYMADGRYKKISEVKIGEYVHTLNGPKKVIDSGCTGMKSTIIVKTELTSIECTENHPLLTQYGWKKAILCSESTLYTIGVFKWENLDLVRKLRMLGLLLYNGTNQMKAGRGIRNRLLLLTLEKLYTKMQNVVCAIIYSLRKKRTNNSAETPVNLPIEDVQVLTTRHGHACVDTNILLTNIAQLNIARSNVVEILDTGEKKPVYNLTVEDCPEYFANGVLVHNCRYLCAEVMKRSGVVKEKPDPFAPYTARKEKNLGRLREALRAPSKKNSDGSWQTY